jgi:uncharacterized Zn finger protein
VARRALREARERDRAARAADEENAAVAAEEAAGAAGAGTEDPAHPGPTSTDVSGKAVAPGRDHVRTPEESEDGARPHTDSGEAPGAGGSAPQGARPGDVAREALRAARARTRAREADPGERAVKPGRDAAKPGPGGHDDTGAAPAAPGPRKATPRGPASGSVRAVRELLDGAFGLPTATDGALTTDTAVTSDVALTPDTPVPNRTEVVNSGAEQGGSEASGPAGSAAEDDRARVEPSRTAPGPESGPAPASAHRPRPPVSPSQPAPRPASPSEPPAAARTPRTMATPHRDGDLRRTFAAFPAREATKNASFAGTWWGNAWVAALEEGALDTARLTRGRAYAQRGHVDAITVTPGLVLAYVQGSRVRPYRVQVRLRTLGDDEWERFLDAAADRPGHIAALLDGEVPPSLADCGVPLLPLPGDLDPHCSCPDSGHPCKHAAALCYQAARLLDTDPFVLFLLRGRGEREVLDDLSRRSAARAARAAQNRGAAPLTGIRATEALTRGSSDRPPLPRPLPAPPHPEQPPVYPGVPGGPDAFALDQLATDAATRAHALLTTGRDPVGGLSLWEDAVRLAAARPGSGLTVATRTLYSSLAAAAGRSPGDLARAVAAWRQGGHEGLVVLEQTWDPPAGRFDRARALLLAAGLPAFRPRHNRLTHPRDHVQLRFGRDGVWYAYESEPGHDDWWPRGTPDLDPVGALTGVAGPDGV